MDAETSCGTDTRENLSILNHVPFSSFLFCFVNTGLPNSVTTTTLRLFNYIFCLLCTAGQNALLLLSLLLLGHQKPFFCDLFRILV